MTHGYISTSTANMSSEDAQMLGIGSDAVLAALATVVRKPRNPNARMSSPALVLEPSAARSKSATPLAQAKRMELLSTSSLVVNSVVQRADSRVFTSESASDTLHFVSPPVATADSSLSVENSLDTATTVLNAKTHETISPSAKTIPTSNVVDLTESTLTSCPQSKRIPVTKRQKMTEYRRNSKNDSQADVAKDTVGISTEKFRSCQPEEKRRMQTAIVDYWFNDDTRGQMELIKYVQEAVKTIKIGMDTLNNEEMIKQLGVAVSRGVTVQLFIDFKKACDGGLEWVKEVLEAGVQVCHFTEKFEWKAVIFDSQILVQGDLQVFDMGYTMVHTGQIASVFESQFDTMWKTAAKKVKDGKRARTDTSARQREVESCDTEAEVEPGEKRKQGKRTCFPTTLAFLEMLGL